MERLTRKMLDGRYGLVNGKELGTVRNNRAVIDRLAAYEDIGLEPEEIKTALDGAIREFMAYDDLGPIDHLRELVRAEKDGRLVALPCKVGETAWVKDRAGIPREMKLEAPDIRFACIDEDNLCRQLCERKPGGICAYRIKSDGSDVGGRVFLTREEAEAAMGGGSDNET